MASQWKYGTTPRNAFFCFHDTTPATHEPLEYEVQKLHRVLALFSVWFVLVVSKVPKNVLAVVEKQRTRVVLLWRHLRRY